MVNVKKLEQFHIYARGNGLIRFIPTAYRGEVRRGVPQELIGEGEDEPRGSDRGGAHLRGPRSSSGRVGSSCGLGSARLRNSCGLGTARLRSVCGEVSSAPQGYIWHSPGGGHLTPSIGKVASPQDGISGRSPAVRDRSIKLLYLAMSLTRMAGWHVGGFSE